MGTSETGQTRLPDRAGNQEQTKGHKKMSSTKDVLNHHIQSFGEGNLNGILSDYASNAVMFTPNGPLEGVEAIKNLFKGLLAEFAKPGSSFKLNHESVKGDYAYILWSAETADNIYDILYLY